MPNFKQKIKNFISKYSKQKLSNKLNKLIGYIRNSSENSGSSLWKFLMAILLLMLIFCQGIGVFIKNIIPHIRNIVQSMWAFLNNCLVKFVDLVEQITNAIIEFFKVICDFIVNILFIAIISEIGFYFKIFRNSSQELKDNLTLVVQKLQDYSDFLAKKLENGNAEFKTVIQQSSINLLLKSFLYFFMFCFYLILALIMSIVLLVGSVILLPIFHQYIREEKVFVKN